MEFVGLSWASAGFVGLSAELNILLSFEMKTVLFVINRFAAGGAETQVRRISVGLARRGWGVSVVSLMRDVIDTKELDEAGVERTSLECSRGLYSLLGVFPLVGRLRERTPDVVVSMMIPADPVARVATAIASVPLVSSLRGERVGGRAVVAFLRMTDRWVACLTANAERIRRVLGHRVTSDPRRIEIVRNAIVASDFRVNPETRSRVRGELGLDCREFVWVSVGSQRPPKNYVGLLRAFSALDSGKLLIVGAPFQADELTALAKELGVSDRIVQLGRRSDVPDILAASDAFVLASHNEGLPNAVMEAMAAGLPVVATDVGGVSELLPTSAHGVRVKARDPNALIEGMRKLAGMSDDERRAMGLCAQAHIGENYELDSVLNHWESLLNRVAGEHRSTRAKAD